jgi:hypothetical protein
MSAVKNRMRHLIGSSHWLSDGEHKEAVLRGVLRKHMAQSLEIGRGFVCAEDDTSTQIDVLISHCNKPMLFRDGDTLLVTPDAVAAIIEVKTRLNGVELDTALKKLADDAAIIRRAGNVACVAGLFIYDPLISRNAHRRLLKSVQAASNGEKERVVNWVAAGPDLFVRYWPEGAGIGIPINGPVWHSYTLVELSHAYFVSNTVWDTCPDLDRKMQYAWFPVEGGKERYRKSYISLNDQNPQDFNDPGGAIESGDDD